MKEDLINYSIEKEKLQLNLSEKFKYYTLPALLIFCSFLCFTDGFQNTDLSKLNFADPIPKIGMIIFIFGIVCFLAKLKSLKLHSVNIVSSDVKQKIFQIAEKRNWKVVSDQTKLLVLKTSNRYSYENFPFKNRLTGQLIYIFFAPKKILLISITDLKDLALGFDIPKGDNASNEKAIIDTIESQPPTAGI